MTTTEALQRIKALFVDAPPVAPAVPALPAPVSYPLADGTVATIDNLAVGGNVTINGVPAQDGIIVLADGTAVTTVGGVITLVAAAQAADPSTDLPGQMAAMQAQLKQFADGATPDQAGMVTIVRALFESVFGYEIRRAKEQTDRDAAIAVYNQGFSEQKAASDATIATLQAQAATHTEAFAQLIPLVEKMAETEIVAPAEVKKDFSDMSKLEQYRSQK